MLARRLLALWAAREAARAGQQPPSGRDDLPGDVDDGLRRAPDVPAEASAELLVIKSGEMFLCVRTDGEVRPERFSGEGLFVDDTRHLSELSLTLGGVRPVLLSSSVESGHHATVNHTNAALRSGETVLVEQGTLDVRRTLLVSDRLHCRVRLRSFSPQCVRITLEVTLGADFADVFEVRGHSGRVPGRLVAPELEGDTIRFGFVAEDGKRRETLVELDPAPSHVELGKQRGRVRWEVELARGQTVTFAITAEPVRDERSRMAQNLDDAAADLDRAHRTWVDSCTRIESDNELFDRVVDASVRDLHALMTPAPGGELPAAGIPWYVAPFGRDSVLASYESLMINPEVARKTMLVLARLQAHADEPWRDAEPGKILHELRRGELARTGLIPHTPYYGTVDATPLFLALAGSYLRWTRDLETLAELRAAFDRALEWIDRYGDLDGDGFVEYERRAPSGLVNQGWKDSHDAVVHADGTLAEGPIALVEVQGYVYLAKRRIAEVYDALGDQARARELRAQAAALREAFNSAFWNPDEGTFALALDGSKRQVRSVTSNPAHCLWSGIVDPDKAGLVAERLMAQDMFSGWGIRTLSSDSPAYNPMSYHNGSVWPHDNAIAAAGLKRYGFNAATGRIASALFEVAARARDFRLPELYCGFDRHESSGIVAYPVACIPQAWAAAAPFMLLQACLGISADAAENTLTVSQPSLPEWLDRVELRDVSVAGSRVSLGFGRDSGSTGWSVLEQRGDVRVTSASR